MIWARPRRICLPRARPGGPLMKELGFDGSTLDNLVAGVAPKAAEEPAVTVMETAVLPDKPIAKA